MTLFISWLTLPPDNLRGRLKVSISTSDNRSVETRFTTPSCTDRATIGDAVLFALSNIPAEWVTP